MRHVVPRLFESVYRRWLPALLLAPLVLGGCSDDPSSPSGTRPEPRVPLPVLGVQIPSEVEEGEPVSISVWGDAGDPSLVVDEVQARIVAEPMEGPGRIEIQVWGRRGAPEMPWGHEDGGPGPRVEGPYQAPGVIPPLAPGEYRVVLPGFGHREMPLWVRPSSAWVRFRTYGHPDRPDLALAIRRDGEAVAWREGEPCPGRLRLTEEGKARIMGWFEEADFFGLEDRYLSDPPAPGPRVEVFYRPEEIGKRVLAEERRMPEALAALVAQLTQATLRILENRPEPPLVWGWVEVEPPSAPPDVPRTLRLAIANRAERPVTLVFPTAQIYDLAIISVPPWPGEDGGPRGTMEGEDPTPPPPDIPTILFWNWAHGRDFPQVVTELTLEPGEVRTFEEPWDGRTNDGEVLPPGLYGVIGPVMTETTPVPVRPARLIVDGPSPPPPFLGATVAVEPMHAPPGTSRTLTLTVTNLGSEPVTRFFTSTQRYDFAVFDPARWEQPGGGGMDGGGPCPGDDPMHRPGLIWLWSHDKGFGDATGEEVWAPGEAKVWSEIWDGTTMEGVPVGPGIYGVTAWVTSEGPVPAPPVAFVVTRP